MRRFSLLPILLPVLLFSCTPHPVTLSDVTEKDGETYFTIKECRAEYQGVFGQAVNPQMWKVGSDDIVKVEQIVERAVQTRKTHRYDLDTRRIVTDDLTDAQSSLLLDLTSKAYYRVYTAGTNSRHNRIMEVLFYPAPGSTTIVADILVDSSDVSVQIR